MARSPPPKQARSSRSTCLAFVYTVSNRMRVRPDAWAFPVRGALNNAPRLANHRQGGRVLLLLSRFFATSAYAAGAGGRSAREPDH